MSIENPEKIRAAGVEKIVAACDALASQPQSITAMIEKLAEPEVRLSFMQINFLKRLAVDKRSWLTGVQGGWALMPLVDDTIKQLELALEAERARAIRSHLNGALPPKESP